MGGDLNINILGDNTYAKDFGNIIKSYSFYNVKTTPTRVTVTGECIFDLFIVNIDAPVLAAGTINYDTSDHCPNSFCLLPI